MILPKYILLNNILPKSILTKSYDPDYNGEDPVIKQSNKSYSIKSNFERAN